MTMTAATEIEIDTIETRQLYLGAGGIFVHVTEEKPWDQLSKIFNKYTHTITYPGAGVGYNASQYNIKVNVPDYSGRSVFTLNTPNPKVDAVELYFRTADTDISKAEPLIVGFVYDGSDRSSSKYYTWNYLKSTSTKVGTITDVDSFGEKDLINGLLEELGRTPMGSGMTIRDRENKLVIRLDEKPTGESTYPESKYFTEGEGIGDSSRKQVKVKKQEVFVSDDTHAILDTTKVEGYVSYEHTVPGCNIEDLQLEFDDAESVTGCGVEDLYVSYKNNSRFFQVGTGGSDTRLKVAKIKSVTAYFETGTNKLVLITFTLSTGTGQEPTFAYSYYDFVNDLKKGKAASRWLSGVKIITSKGSGFQTIDQSKPELKKRLKEESERLRPLIAFLNDSGRKNNENIMTSHDVVREGSPIQGYSFMKVIMTPDTKDKEAGFAVGPWYVYNNQLFIAIESKMKIQPDTVLTGITTGDTSQSSSKKYNSITVYYSTKDNNHKALLVEFDQAATGDSIRLSTSSSSAKLYYKRTNKDGTKWAKETGISSSGVFVTADKLAKIEKGSSQEESKRSKPLIEFKSGDGTGSGVNKHITTSEPTNVGTGSGRGYKFMKVVMTPNTSDLGEGSSSGPWTVYSSKLITRGSNKKMQASFSGVISGSKYKSIGVYYAVTGKSNTDYKALLVEFVPDGCGKKKYFKREKVEGTKWVISYGIGTNTGSNSELIRILQQESNRLRPLLEFEKGDGRSGDENKNIRTMQHNVGNGDKFIKVVMTPNTDVKDVLGVRRSSVGPWTVYNTKLFDRESDIKIQPEPVLELIVTTTRSGPDDTDSSSNSKKYHWITVYYFLKGSSKYKALLVEFVPGSDCGRGIYFKRTNKDGTQWAKAEAGEIIGNVDEGVLTKIAKNADIIGSNVGIKAMMAQQKEIQINTYRTTGSYVCGGSEGGQVTVNVIKYEPWDKLSKIFKKYRHTIEYPREGDGSQYDIALIGSGRSGFTYESPNPKVKEVEVYFRFGDFSNNNPLVVGFVYDGSDSSSGTKCYYNWNKLTSTSSGKYSGTITGVESISQNDLITGLLQELARTVPSLSSRQNKVVIRLGEQPDGDDRGDHRYPGSGYYSDKQVTVKKVEARGLAGLAGFDGLAGLRDVPGFDGYDNVVGYEHSVSSSIVGTGAGETDEFYVSYENDSMYIVTGSGSWSWSWSWLGYGSLKKAAAYFDTTGRGTGGHVATTTTGGDRNSKRLVLIVFSFKGIYGRDGGSGTGVTYVYPYSDFVNDVNDLRGRSNWFSAANTIMGGYAEIYYRRDNPKGTTLASDDGIDIGTSDAQELRRILQEERERLEHLIEFKEGDGSISTSSRNGTVGTTTGRISPVSTGGHKHIKTEGPSNVGHDTVNTGYTFRKYTMTANADDARGGRPGGPWTVYSGYLFTNNRGNKIDPGAKIPEDVLTSNGIVTGDARGTGSGSKYSSISVYYVVTVSGTSGSNNSALLVEFCAGDGVKKYIKRTGKVGTEWLRGDGVAIGIDAGGNVTVGVLTEIAKKAYIIDDGDSESSNDGDTDGEEDEDAEEEDEDDSEHSGGSEEDEFDGGNGRGAASNVSSSVGSQRGESGSDRGNTVSGISSLTSSDERQVDSSTSSDSSIPNPSGPAGIATGVVGVGAGAGYAIYKNLEGLMGLIGRIAGR